VTVGKIGCGGRGGGIGGVGGQIVAAADPWRSRAARYARSGAEAYTDFGELLARDDIDAVAVATCDHWHVPATIAAAEAGKGVYCEKPLGVSIREDLLCREAVRRNGVAFQYGTQQRSSRHCRFGCELVRSGYIGEVKEIFVAAPNSQAGGSIKPIAVPADLDYEMWLGPAPWRPYVGQAVNGGSWWHCYDYAIGFIAGWGAHPLDILVWGYDTHRAGLWEVEGTGTIDRQNRNDVVRNWDVHIRFANGVKMHFVPGGNYTKWTGTEGWVGASRGGIKAEPASLLKVRIGSRSGDVSLQRSTGGHGKDFADAVRGRRDPVSFIEDAVRSDIISHVGDIAVRTGRKIVWDPVKETIVGDPEAARMLTRPMREPWRI
jgi:predicted dehydrogenase